MEDTTRGCQWVSSKQWELGSSGAVQGVHHAELCVCGEGGRGEGVCMAVQVGLEEEWAKKCSMQAVRCTIYIGDIDICWCWARPISEGSTMAARLVPCRVCGGSEGGCRAGQGGLG
jgi:hypothetical protein